MQPELSYVQHNMAADLIVKCMKHSVPKVRMAESRCYRRWEGKTERQKSDFVKMLFGNGLSVPLFCPGTEVAFRRGISLQEAGT